MATRTQKAAKKQKAEAAKKEPSAAAEAGKTGPAGAEVPKPAKPAKPPKPAKSGKQAKGAHTKQPKPATSSKGKSRKPAAKPLIFEETPPPAPGFWQRLKQRSNDRKAAAHQLQAERQAEREAAERHAAEAQAAAALEQQRQAEADARHAAAAAALEAKRLADEEDARRKDEVRQAKAAKAREAREAKAVALAAAEQAKADKAAERAARRKAAREAQAKPVAPAPSKAEPASQAIVEFSDLDEPSTEAPSRKGATRDLPPPATDIEAQADRFAAELAARRSKPIQIDAEEDVAPALPVGRRAAPAEAKEVLTLDPAPPARIETAPRGLSVPEQFLLLTLEGTWDERRERNKPGGLGGALAGALLLDLLVQGKVRVQRDRFQLTGTEVDDAAGKVADKLALWADRPSQQVMQELAKWIPQLLPPYKQRMQARGLLEARQWRHLGLFYRSQTALVDVEAQERLRNKLGRAIAGGGRPDAATILALGLLEACGLFGLVVPEGAQAYNRKRLNGLLAGKDVMGYKVDDELRGMQEMAVRTILDNVRQMTR